jgi:hypothetical protein
MRPKAFVGIWMLLLAQAAAAQADWRVSRLADGGRTWLTSDLDFLVYSVAISGNGAIAVVGGTGPDFARVYTRNGGIWTKQAGIPLGSGASNFNEGFAAAISADGGTVVVGGPEAAAGLGGAWVYTRTGAAWSEQARLVPSEDSDYLGVAVAASADGNTAIIGAPGDHDYLGAALIFTRSGGVWTQQGPKLIGASALGSAQQGYSVAISADGNTAIVGGPSDDMNVGAVWVYTRIAGVWSQQGGKLVGSDRVGASFQGSSVTISADGNTVVVGGAGDNSHIGAAWVFTRTDGVWSQQGPKLVGSDAVGTAFQGAAVAISGDARSLVLGGPGDDQYSGAAWVFTRSNGTWSQIGSKLVASTAAARAQHGTAVAISGNGATFVVGAPADGSTGAAWVFSNSAEVAGWVPAAAHTAGLNQTQWRSDLGLLNPGASAANVQLQFFGSGGIVSNTIQVPAGAQSILTDVVAQLGADGQGALEITADQPLKITARTYNQAPSDAGCFPNGTQGQSFPVLTAGGGLAAGQSAYLPGLVQNADYRSNIGLVNTDEALATVLVELFDGAGGKLAEYTVTLAHGQWAQENRPFEKKAGQTALDRGYAKVTVQSGSGVYAFASVIDNVTNDPTTVAMQR